MKPIYVIVVSFRIDHDRTRAVSSHRTLKAAQRALRKLQKSTNWANVERTGFLTSHGLLNYNGEPMQSPAPNYGAVACKMVIEEQ